MSRSITTIKTSTTIRVKPALVYGVLSHFKTYKNWNPWITQANGNCTEGAEVFARHNFFGTVKHKLTEVRSPEKLLWELSGWQRHFVGATREVLIYPNMEKNNTLVTMKVVMQGPFLPIAVLLFRRNIKNMMNAEIRALRKFCEEQTSS